MKKLLLFLQLFIISVAGFSQVKISEMTVTTDPSGLFIPGVRGGSNFRLNTDSLRLNKVDSVKVSNDSVFYYKYGGTKYFAGKFVVSEVDPVFVAHPVYGITAPNISNWNTAYSWGNHAGLYIQNQYVTPQAASAYLSGKVLIHNPTITNDVFVVRASPIYASGIGAVGQFENYSTSQPWHNIVRMWSPNMTVGQRAFFNLGKGSGSYNESQVGFYYNGNNSPNNFLTLGFWGKEEILQIEGTGRIALGFGLGGFLPHRLAVNGSVYIDTIPHATAPNKVVVTEDSVLKHLTFPELLEALTGSENAMVITNLGDPANFDSLLVNVAEDTIGLKGIRVTPGSSKVTVNRVVTANDILYPVDVDAEVIQTAMALVKGDVGLGNVDNTSDVNKPISTATQTALDAKQATLVSGTNIKTVNGNSLLGSGDLVISGGGSGTVNSGNQYRIGYYATTGTAISEAAAITANRVLLSDANGVPVHSSVTNTTLGFLDATSSIQTQLNAKQATISETDNQLAFSSNVLTMNKAINALTDGATITWNAQNGFNASVTLGGNRTLDITNPQSGDVYIFDVTQDGSGNRTLALPGGGSAPLNLTAAAKTTLVGTYRGTTWEWNVRLPAVTTAGESYATISANTQILTFSAVNLSGTHVTGDLPYSNLAQASARSVLGVTGNATADVASIQGTANQVLRINSGGTALAFGSIDVSSASAVTGIMAAANGGTGNGFTAFTGPTTSTKTFTLPNATATILTTNAAVTAAQGGTGNTTYTNGQLLIGNTTGNTLTKGTLSSNDGSIKYSLGGGTISIEVEQTVIGGSLHTPTATSITNVSSSTVRITNVIRTHNIIHVAGVVEVTPTAGSDITIDLSLPFASDFANEFELSGGVHEKGNPSIQGVIYANTTDNRARLFIKNSATGNLLMYFQYTYQITTP